jgi:citrate synthase
METASRYYQTMSTSSPSQILVRGYDLCEELIGKVDFASMIFLELTGKLPSQGEARLMNAALVSLTEHGMTGSSIATRLTYLAAPSSVQGAIAAGILGAGDVFLGTVENCGRILQELVAEEDLEAAAANWVREARARGQKIPGIGHPLHKPTDPRTEVLFRLAEGLSGAHVQAIRLLQKEAERQFGRAPLPINDTGALAAVLSDMGFSWRILRGFSVVARAGGLLGHIWDEIQHPVGRRIWTMVDETIPYRDPADSSTD